MNAHWHRRRRASSKIGAFALVGVLATTAAVTAMSGTASAVVPPTPVVVAGFGDGTGSCTVAPTTITCPTLRLAIARANSFPGTTITLPAGVYSLTKGPISVGGAGTKIVGAASPVGANPTLVNAGGKRGFEIAGKNVVFSGLAITNGNGGLTGGGAIAVNPTATGFVLSDSTIFGNVGSVGGGVEVFGSALIERSTFTGNSAAIKGGAIHASGIVEVVNSTFTGNSGGRGGAIAIWALGKGAISYSTFVDNTSFGRLGGGVDRYSGSLVVTGSVLTATGATAKTGSDCANGPKLIGLNFVGNTVDCVIAGTPLTATSPGPMTLGALANNGGPTQTIAPAGGSVGLDVNLTECKVVGTNGFLGAALTVDQRGLPRPSGRDVPPRCDLGAFETMPFDVELALSSSTATPPVGASTIPAANIPGAVSDTQALFSQSSREASPIKAFPIKAFPLEAAPIKAFPIKAFPIKAFPIKAFLTASLPIKAFPIKAFPIKAFPLDTILLSDLVLLTEGGWERALQGTPLEGVPLQAITLTDVQNMLADPALPAAKRTEIENIDFGDLQVDGTPLATFPTLAFLLWSLPLSAIPLAGSTGDATPQWCAAYPDFCSAATTAGTLGAATPASLVLAGESLDEAGLEETPLGTFFQSSSLQSFPIKAFPIKAFDMESSPIKAFPIKAFPIKAFGTLETGGIIDCTKVDCVNGTLGDVSAADAWTAGVTLESLIALVAGDPALRAAFDEYGLFDLLVALIPPESVPWEQVDLTVAGIQNAASPLVDPFEYLADITLSTAATTTTLQVVLPEGFAYVPGGSTLNGQPLGNPVLSISSGTDGCGAGADRTILTYTLPNLPAGLSRVAVAVRAGLTLGIADADACVVATAGTQSDLSSATTNVTVVEDADNPLPTIRPLAVTNDTAGTGVDVNLGYVSRSGSVDLYSFDISEADANLGIRGDLFLSNLPADYDLVLYGGRTAPLRNQPTSSVGYVDDVLYDLNPLDDPVQADTVQDVPQTLPTGLGFNPADYVPVAISSNRGVNDEQIQTGTLREGTYFVQISAYNAGFSDEPYALRFRTDGSAERTCPTVLTYPTGGAGVLPAPSSLSADVNTLFLVNEQLLRATYGSEAQSILDATSRVAAAKQFGVSGAIIPVEGLFEGGHAVEDAYRARFADPCNPLRSNDIVRAIGEVIDSYTAARPGIRNIVIIGDDRQIPMANIVDDTNFANERTFAQDFVGNDESIAALLAGMYRTDDPYGTTAGISVRDHELFVPDRAVGRLVETPAEIIRSLDNFITYQGRLDPATTQNTALETGYEFLSDGAELNAKNLEARGYSPVVRVINEAWTDGALAAALGAFQTNPVRFDVIGLHGHFDQNNALPALDNAAKLSPNDPDTQPGFGPGSDSMFSSDEFPAVQNRAVVYSMGCHAGYSRSDVQVGSPAPDWAQRLVGALGNVFAGNTGYGYGDSDIVALSESLTAQFATEVGQPGSIGQAWVDAKQQTVANVHVLDAYQEKVVEEFVFYGLPMFWVGANPPAATVPAGPPAVPPSTLPDAGFGGLKVATVVATPNFTGTAAAPNPVVTPSGSYYTVGGKTLDVNGRPIQPLFTSDITRPGLVARDALITGLSSKDVGNFDPVFFKAATDFGQPRPEYLDGSFPAELASVRSSVLEGQNHQQLLLGVGQFRGSEFEATPETPQPGVQRLHTRVETAVYYGASNPTDIAAPSIDRSRGFVDDGVAFFEVSASDVGGDVKRVFILFRGTTGTTWSGLDLTKGPDGVWRGGRGFTGDRIEFAVQAVDSSGNVAMSNSKSLFFLDADPVPLGQLLLLPEPVVPGAFTNPWFTADVNVTIVGATPTTTYSVDGAASETYTGAPILISGDGGHVITALDTTTGLVAELYVAIDSTAPAESIPVPEGFVQGPFPVTATFDDGEGAGVTSIVASANGVQIGVVTFDEPARRGELTTDPITAQGATTITFVATDAAGNVKTASRTVSIDNVAPIVTVVKTPASEFATGNVTIGVLTDTGGSPIAERWYTVAGDPPGTKRPIADPWTTEGATEVTGFALDAAGNIGQSAPPTSIKIDKTPPVPAVTVSSNVAPLGSSVSATFSCADSFSGVASCVLTVDGVVVSSSPGTVVLPPTLTPRTYALAVTSTDVAGNPSAAPATASVEFKQFALGPFVTVSPSQVTVGGSVTANWGCSGGAAAGVASCVLTLDGAFISSTPGQVVLPVAQQARTYNVLVTATPLAGPAETATASYTAVPAAPKYVVCNLGYNPATAKNVGSAFTFTFKLCDSAGKNVSSSSIVLVAKVVNPGGYPAVPMAPGGSNPGNEFIFGNGGYSYTLKTTGLPPGELTLTFVVKGDPSNTIYSLPFKLKR